MSQLRVFIVGHERKPEVKGALEALTKGLTQQAQIVGTSLGVRADELAGIEADFVIVLGGDGTILATARALGHRALPIIGVNLGKLGFLAEFSVAELVDQFAVVTSEPSLIGKRMILEVQHRGEPVLAINDACVLAGPPFRMIELECYINGERLTRMSGDGLILSTPTGSTAHNMAVGGPILLPSVRAIVVTPMAPQSLALTPIVVDSDSIVEVRVLRVNEGTTLLIDGQLSSSLEEKDVLRVRRFGEDFRLVHNPCCPHWHTLVTKLRWGQTPSYNASGTGPGVR